MVDKSSRLIQTINMISCRHLNGWLYFRIISSQFAQPHEQLFLLERRRLHQSKILNFHQLTRPFGHVHMSSMRPLMKVSAVHSKLRVSPTSSFLEFAFRARFCTLPSETKRAKVSHTASYASMTFKRESAPWMPLQHLLLSVSQMPRLLLSFLWKFLETPTQWRSQVSWINAYTPVNQTKWAYEDTIIYELFFCIFLCLAPTLNHQLHSHSGAVLVPVLFIPHSEKK